MSMPNLSFYYFTLYIISTYCVYCHISVQDSGVYPVEEGDIALIFYVTLANECDEDYGAVASMQQCVEMIDDDVDTRSIQLIGGDMGIIKPQTSKNITLIYPNTYLYNRAGSCTVEIQAQAKTKKRHVEQMTVDIAFNTSFFNSDDDDDDCPSKSCASIDLDPTQKCEPVDCRIKYSGARSFFNRQSRRCEEVPECMTNFASPTPDIAYNPFSNRCKDLKNAVTKSDLELLESNNFVDFGHEMKGTLFRCHHGIIDNDTGECICHKGWTSSMEDDFEPTLGVIHMCNIEISCWLAASSKRMKMTGLLIAIIVITLTSKILIAMCILHMCLKYLKSRKDEELKEDKPCRCSEELIKQFTEKTSSSGSKSRPLYACEAIFVENPFKQRSRRSRSRSTCNIKITTKTRSNTTTSTKTSSTDEIRIFVQQAPGDSNNSQSVITVDLNSSDKEDAGSTRRSVLSSVSPGSHGFPTIDDLKDEAGEVCAIIEEIPSETTSAMSSVPKGTK